MSVFTEELLTTFSLYWEVITRLTTARSLVVTSNYNADKTADYANSFDFDFGATVNIGNKKMTDFEENLFYVVFATVIVLSKLEFSISSFTRQKAWPNN